MRRERSHCPINFGLELFGDRWTLLILRDLLLRGSTTYSEFQDGGEGITTAVLANRLTQLESDGLVHVTRGPGGRRGLRYQPTEKAIDLLPVLMAITVWSSSYDAETIADPAIVAQIRSSPKAFEQALRHTITQGLNGEDDD